MNRRSEEKIPWYAWACFALGGAIGLFVGLVWLYTVVGALQHIK